MYDHAEYTVTHWDGSRVLCRNTGLRLPDAQEIAGQWSGIVGSATVDADEGDYREVMSDLCKECIADFARDGVALCPLHAQAEGMRALILRNVRLIEEASDESGYQPGVDECLWLEDARALLRAVETK